MTTLIRLACRSAHAALLLTSLLAVAADQPPTFAEKLAAKKLLQQVCHGGYVLYMRHGTTDNSRQAGLPVADIHVSPLCRTKESAGAAFGHKIQVDNDLMYTANLTGEQKKPILQSPGDGRFKYLASIPPGHWTALER